MNLKIIGVSGSPRHANTEVMVKHALEAAKSIETPEVSVETQFISLAQKNVRGCLNCRGCVRTGKCVLKDDWDELCQIMDWTTTHVHSTLHICWGAQAGLYYHYGIPKYDLGKKLFGVFPHKVVRTQSPLFRGFDDIFYVPHSRYTENRLEDIEKVPELQLLSVSEKAGVFAVKSRDNRRFFITGHPEYDPETLSLEYFRDVNKGIDINIPDNYFPNDDPSQPPVVRWRSAGQLFYTNWLNYYVYQTTPYDLRSISDAPRP